ncbi:hypothetical protein NQZ68_029207 [Dissostichus eleginoides]|nr:hypothetical protein NQZ68_029207 [Dissostichus eleginoides]
MQTVRASFFPSVFTPLRLLGPNGPPLNATHHHILLTELHMGGLSLTLQTVLSQSSANHERSGLLQRLGNRN